MRINPDRPIEMPVGSNRGIIIQRVGNMHCMTPFTEAVRACRPKNIRRASPALRRGVILLVHQTMMDARDTYLRVMTGALR